MCSFVVFVSFWWFYSVLLPHIYAHLLSILFFYHFSILLAYVHLLHYVFSLIYFPLVLFLLYCDIFIIFMSVFFK